MADSKFILFAHPRSGSTILAEILALHPQLRVLIEPFAEHFHTWSPGNKNYLAQIVDTASLDWQLTDLFTAYDGIKVTSWPLSFDLYHHMLLHEGRKIIFLRRENLLRAAVSNAISHQTHIWEKRKAPADMDARYKGLQDISIDDLAAWIEAVKKGMNAHETGLQSRPKDMVKMVTFETVYDHPSHQKNLVYDLFDFLGVERMYSDEMKWRLDKTNSQMNAEDRYRAIPNYQDIDARLSCKDYGFLFGS